MNALAGGNVAAEWNGYLQERLSGDADRGQFSVRRLKAWLICKDPDGPFAGRIQALYRSDRAKYPVLQDAYLSFGRGVILLKAGQFVPRFSLQRSQNDAFATVLERAMVVDALIPGAETLARRVGIETILEDHKSASMLALGIFNADDMETPQGSGNLFLTSRCVWGLHFQGITLHPGMSFACRRARNVDIHKISGSSELFSGQDTRWGLENLIELRKWSVQGEYLQASLGNRIVSGWYVIVEGEIMATDRVAFSIERFSDLDPATGDDPRIAIICQHLINRNKNKVKVELQCNLKYQRESLFWALQWQYFLLQ